MANAWEDHLTVQSLLSQTQLHRTLSHARRLNGDRVETYCTISRQDEARQQNEASQENEASQQIEVQSSHKDEARQQGVPSHHEGPTTKSTR